MERLVLPEEGLLHLFGINDENLRLLEKSAGVRIESRGNEVRLDGPPEKVARVKKLLEEFARLLKQGYSMQKGDFKVALKLLEQEPGLNLTDFFMNCYLRTSSKRVIYPRSINQRAYIRAIQNHDMAFGIGPAGTGKTYLAAAAAVVALRENEVKRLILTRPALEAGEKLGFLPGDMTAKVDPFLRPLYDALNELMGFDKVAQNLERGIIEIAPLAFMRGRNLNDSFIILDEAQNTTSPQMKMFLTRMGNRSRMVINGDITQIDLPKNEKCGLLEAIELLAGLPGLAFIYFEKSDIVRHPLVERIVQAYEERDAAEGESLR
ncbi:MAG TPA: PhoH family protein [Acidobacteriota bacterium]|nr:PhoH family protein [Acidobacteriota bacterium]